MGRRAGTIDALTCRVPGGAMFNISKLGAESMRYTVHVQFRTDQSHCPCFTGSTGKKYCSPVVTGGCGHLMNFFRPCRWFEFRVLCYKAELPHVDADYG